MEETVHLYPSRCAICGTSGNAQELYPANFDLGAFKPEVFSARRSPDRIHYRIVRCDACGLVRSDPVANSEALRQLYTQSTFDYGEELSGLQRTYGRYLKKLDRYSIKRKSLLEIGAGNGFFLEVALQQGYTDVWGVEPSIDAVEQADPHVRSHLVCDVMRPSLFPPATFDVVCLFQVFDHIAEPGMVLDECYNALRSGGVILCLVHNIEALSARLLGRFSPIIDIEHTYLYSPKTIASIFAMHNFRPVQVGRVVNTYSLKYLAHLFPLPKHLKLHIANWTNISLFGNFQFTVPLGNLYLIGRKP